MRKALSHQTGLLLVGEVVVFGLILGVVWLDKFVDVPHRFFGEPETPYRPTEYLFEYGAIAAVGLLVVLVTLWLRRRIERLESFLRVCAWCRRVNVNDEWVRFEDYLASRYHLSSSHGICPDCEAKMLAAGDRKADPRADDAAGGRPAAG
jgi:hypothetical protein